MLIIAELGNTHEGSVQLAKQMIKSASDCGADIIKFQHHIPDEEMLKDVPRSKNFKISTFQNSPVMFKVLSNMSLIYR